MSKPRKNIKKVQKSHSHIAGKNKAETVRQAAEEALRQSESMLRSVFKAAPVGICIMKNRVFQTANDLWYDIIGYTAADLAGQSTRRLYESEEEYRRVGRDLYTDLPKRGLISVETRLRRRDGTITVESELGKGSTFQLTLPTGNPD